MSRPAVKLQIVACVVLFQAVVGVQCADAYTLVDWMRTWPNYYGPGAPAAPAALPTTPPVSPLPVPTDTTPPTITIPPATTPPPAVTTPPIATMPPTVSTPATTSAATTSSASPVYAQARPAGSGWCDWLFGRRAVGYRPEVRYRTRLMRVPTTNYRPVTTYHPVTGTAVSSIQPCTTYSWQFRRVPYTTYRPVYAPARAPWVAPSIPAVTGYYPGTVVSTPSTTCAPPATTPYYTPPPTSITPSLPSAPAFPTTPGPSSAPGSLSTPGGSTPADQAPSLSPPGLPPVENGQPETTIRNYPPMEPIEGANGKSNDEFTDGKSNEVKKEPAPPEGDILQLTPVPDPDAGADRNKVQAAPSLFDPNDRTANRSARPAWSYSTIAWPDKPAASEHVKTTSSKVPCPSGRGQGEGQEIREVVSAQPLSAQEPMRNEVAEPDVSEEKEELESSGWEAVRH